VRELGANGRSDVGRELAWKVAVEVGAPSLDERIDLASSTPAGKQRVETTGATPIWQSPSFIELVEAVSICP
jgi:hypothetical protein